MRLMMLAEGPTLLSRLRTTQAVARHTPRTSACLAVVSHPALINASRISASLEACLVFALRIASLCPILPPSPVTQPEVSGTMERCPVLHFGYDFSGTNQVTRTALSAKKKDRLAAVSPKSHQMFDQADAVTAPFLFLRQRSRPKPARPDAKSGSAPGSGTGFTAASNLASSTSPPVDVTP